MRWKRKQTPTTRHRLYHKNRIASTANQSAVRVSRVRLVLVIVAFAFIYSIIAMRLFNVAILKDETLLARKESNPGEVVYNRADIIDRNGVLLATNLTTASLYANPRIMVDIKEAASLLSKTFQELNKEELLKQFRSDKNFVWVKRNLTPKEQYRANALGIPGVAFKDEEKRVYPHGGLLAHTLGYVGVDGDGLSGVEKYFNERLNKAISTPVELSIDIRVQNILHREITHQMERFSAKAAAGVVMDVQSGEVLGVVSLPDYDPHNPTVAEAGARFNRSTLGVYEMGSTFKSFTMAMALEHNKAGFGSMYNVSKPIRMAGFRIRDFHPKGKWLNLPQVFMYSSNIGTALIAKEIGKKIQKTYLQKLGLTEPLDIEVPEVTRPLLPRQWGELHTMTIAYGHGIAVSPVHVAQAAATLINGGIYRPATLLKSPNTKSQQGTRVFSEKTSDSMRKLFRLVVEHGTGRNSNVEGYLVGGKTGTAEKSIKGGYSQKAMISSFVGAFPMHKPRYVVFAMLDEPKGIKATGGYATGGATAAPLVGNIIRKMGPLLGVQPVGEDDIHIKKQLYVDYEYKGKDLAALDINF